MAKFKQMTGSVAQLAEQRSPKPQVGGSSPSWPARCYQQIQGGWRFLKEIRNELSKIVWPSRQETLQITLIVMFMVLITGLFLWGVDSMVLWLIGELTGTRG
jgi:preprotein translocase SecE subunit